MLQMVGFSSTGGFPTIKCTLPNKHNIQPEINYQRIIKPALDGNLNQYWAGLIPVWKYPRIQTQSPSGRILQIVEYPPVRKNLFLPKDYEHLVNAD